MKNVFEAFILTLLEEISVQSETLVKNEKFILGCCCRQTVKLLEKQIITGLVLNRKMMERQSQQRADPQGAIDL